MNKLNYKITQLLNELQSFESISKEKGKEGEANVMEAQPSSSAKNKNKKEGKEN